MKATWETCYNTSLFFSNEDFRGKLAEGRIQCWAWWVSVLRKRCLNGFLRFFNENHWNGEWIVLDYSYELWEHKLSRAVWEVLLGTFLLGGCWWPKKTSSWGWDSISAGETHPPRTGYFKISEVWGAGARPVSCLQACWVPLFPTYVGHDIRWCPLNF